MHYRHDGAHELDGSSKVQTLDGRQDVRPILDAEVQVGGKVTAIDRWFDFAEGEGIHTENSHKYTIDRFTRKAYRGTQDQALGIWESALSTQFSPCLSLL